jgi:serine/threonine protein kinase
MEGIVLGGRYELVEKIGSGGMAIVFKARCRLLNRFVAIKVLKPEFTNDEEFVKRFRIEAQSAASLSHPNIVSI